MISEYQGASCVPCAKRQVLCALALWDGMRSGVYWKVGDWRACIWNRESLSQNQDKSHHLWWGREWTSLTCTLSLASLSKILYTQKYTHVQLQHSKGWAVKLWVQNQGLHSEFQSSFSNLGDSCLWKPRAEDALTVSCPWNAMGLIPSHSPLLLHLPLSHTQTNNWYK